MDKSPIKKPNPRLVRLDIQRVAQDGPLKAQALVWGCYKDQGRRLLGWIFRTVSYFPEADAGRPLWQYRNTRTGATLVETHAGFTDLVALIARHHAILGERAVDARTQH